MRRGRRAFKKGIAITERGVSTPIVRSRQQLQKLGIRAIASSRGRNLSDSQVNRRYRRQSQATRAVQNRRMRRNPGEKGDT